LEVVSIDGAPTRTLALPAAFGFAYDLPNIGWSPDGRTIAFTGCGGCQAKGSTSVLWVERVDGTGLTSLGGGPFAYDPVWAPDGSLLFGQGSLVSTPVGLAQIRSDGSGYRRVLVHAQWLGEIEPSPDGSRILLRGNPETVMTVDADGTNPVVATGIASGFGARWSLDGRRLLTIVPSVGLVEFDADGSHLMVLLPNLDAFDLGGSR
jgi:Tol biopolymer transport system component